MDSYLTYLRTRDPAAIGFGPPPVEEDRTSLMRQLFRTILEVVPPHQGRRTLAIQIDAAERRQEARDAKRHHAAS